MCMYNSVAFLYGFTYWKYLGSLCFDVWSLISWQQCLLYQKWMFFLLLLQSEKSVQFLLAIFDINLTFLRERKSNPWCRGRPYLLLICWAFYCETTLDFFQSNFVNLLKTGKIILLYFVLFYSGVFTNFHILNWPWITEKNLCAVYIVVNWGELPSFVDFHVYIP